MRRNRQPHLRSEPLLERVRRWTSARPASVGFVAGAFVLAFVMQACTPGFAHGADRAVHHGGHVAATTADEDNHASDRHPADPCCLADLGHVQSPYPAVVPATDTGPRLPSVDGVAIDTPRVWGRVERPPSAAALAVDAGVDGADLYLATLRLRI